MTQPTRSDVGQIREITDPRKWNSLCTHRLKPDRTPACGDKMRPWKGTPMVMVEMTPDTPVTCGRNGCR